MCIICILILISFNASELSYYQSDRNTFLFTRLRYVSLALPGDNLSHHHINSGDNIDDNKILDFTTPHHSFMDFHFFF